MEFIGLVEEKGSTKNINIDAKTVFDVYCTLLSSKSLTDMKTIARSMEDEQEGEYVAGTLQKHESVSKPKVPLKKIVGLKHF